MTTYTVIDLTCNDGFIDIEIKKTFKDKEKVLNWIEANRNDLVDIVKLLIISPEGIKFEEV